MEHQLPAFDCEASVALVVPEVGHAVLISPRGSKVELAPGLANAEAAPVSGPECSGPVGCRVRRGEALERDPAAEMERTGSGLPVQLDPGSAVTRERSECDLPRRRLGRGRCNLLRCTPGQSRRDRDSDYERP